MLAFVERHGLTFPSVVDRPGEIFAKYGVPYQPAWVFVAGDGTLMRFQGSLDGEALKSYLDALV
jgi:hypothetical protein